MSSTSYILPDFGSLTPDQISKINNNSIVVKHNKGEIIFSQEKPISYLMFLSSGLIKMYKEVQDKKYLILKIVGPGNYIGLFSVFHGSRYDFFAAAIEDSELVYINIMVFIEILNENGRFAVQLMQQFSNEGIDLLNKLVYFPQKQVPGRIAEVLCFFSSEIYNDIHFTLPLSRQELADLVYSTKESVSRTLTEFKNDRMIDIEDRKISLKSIDLLRILCKLG